MKKKNIMVTMLCCVLVSALTLGATLAYLTATTPTLNNVFTIGGFNMPDPKDPGSKDNDIQLKEDKWDPENGKNVEPGKEIDKDPYVTNNSKTLDSYVFLKVEVPLNKEGSDAEELFSYTKNNGWTEISSAGDPKGTHIYAWVGTEGASTMAVLAKNGGKTGTIFDKVVMNNLTKLPAAGTEVTIKVTAYAIQTTLVDGEGNDISATPSAVWELVNTKSSEQPKPSVTEPEPTEP